MLREVTECRSTQNQSKPHLQAEPRQRRSARVADSSSDERAAMKIVLVGEAPNRTGDPSRPLMGRIGKRIADLCNLGIKDYSRAFELRNLLARWPGRSGKGSEFPFAQAKAAAATLRLGKRKAKFVLLGSRLAKAAGMDSIPKFDPARIGKSIVIVVPHPSGINRWWNDRRNVWQARKFFAALASEALRRQEGRRGSGA